MVNVLLNDRNVRLLLSIYSVISSLEFFNIAVLIAYGEIKSNYVILFMAAKYIRLPINQIYTDFVSKLFSETTWILCCLKVKRHKNKTSSNKKFHATLRPNSSAIINTFKWHVSEINTMPPVAPQLLLTSGIACASDSAQSLEYRWLIGIIKLH